MKSEKAGFNSSHEYIAVFPEGTQKMPTKLRITIHMILPGI